MSSWIFEHLYNGFAFIGTLFSWLFNINDDYLFFIPLIFSGLVFFGAIMAILGLIGSGIKSGRD